LVVLVANAFSPELSLVADPATVACTGTEILLSLQPSFAPILWWNGTTEPNATVVLLDTLPFMAMVTAFNAEGCAHRDSILLQAQDCTFISEEGDYPRSPRLYPNPTVGHFFVDASATTVYPLHVAFHAMDGRLLERYVLAEGAVLQPDLGPGVYLVTFSAGPGMQRSVQVVEVME